MKQTTVKKKYLLGTGDTRVLVKRCEDYDPEKISLLISQGMKELGYEPEGKIFIKPNAVYAARKGRYGTTAYTDPSVIEASLLALDGFAGITRIDIGEKTAIGYPTRLIMKYAGFYKTVRKMRKMLRVPVSLFCIDEELRDRVFVGGTVHDTLRVPRRLARADSLVYLPKLKSHCVSNMTGAVKLNIGICSDDERAIRHDFLLNDKIVDLLGPGYPDFVVMDAVDVGVGNEAVPTPRRLGLILMSRNPLAVDIVGARLLGYSLDDVPYLRKAVEAGYGPSGINDIKLIGDIRDVRGLDAQGKKVMPYDDEFYKWQDIHREFKKLKTPMRFFWGDSIRGHAGRCETGCVMGIKMFMAFHERFAGPAAFSTAKPVVFVIGRTDETIDASGSEVFFLGSCAEARVINARRVTVIDKCFTTAVDMTMTVRGRMGIPTPLYDLCQILPLAGNMLIASCRKILSGRYFQDIAHFFSQGLMKKL